MKVYVRIKPVKESEPEYQLTLDYEVNLLPGDSIRLAKPGGYTKVLYQQQETVRKGGDSVINSS